MDETKVKIVEYLESHGLMTLATVTEDGQPMAHSVEYFSEGDVVYFGTHGQTRKITNILNNPKVAYTVDEDYQDWTKIRGIQMTGKATILDDMAEIQRLMPLYAAKFPQIAAFPPEFAQALRLVKVEPTEMKFIDNTKGAGYHEIVKY